MARFPQVLPHVTVIGAGAFGGWTALALRRAGARVTLLDAWGPGNSRASSGGETRIIRGVYGPDRLYVDWVARAFDRWHEHEARWGGRLLQPTGAVWLFEGDDGYARSCLPLMQDAGLDFAEIGVEEARRRFPQFDLGSVKTAFYEPGAGYLFARRACRAVAEAFVAEGGEYRQAAVRPGAVRDGSLERIELSDGSSLAADVYLFACGPWLGEVFPEVVGDRIQVTRQEVYFFGTPAGDPRWSEGRQPIWMDFGLEDIYYGLPGNEDRGLKLAEDTRRESFDPTRGERTVTPERLAAARRYLARRFPELAGAPLVESRVCQYENTADGHFLIDRHPEAGNVWLAGGGSGHGFKFGPVFGEELARLILEEGTPEAMFRLARLEAGGAGLTAQLARK
jgi:glycine/D-amino acid oxidase-like deaminating enzyme